MSPDEIAVAFDEQEWHSETVMLGVIFWLKEIAYQLATMNEGNGTVRQ